jgi:ferric-dicitrate binding protein FerR (iron transport regulator)
LLTNKIEIEAPQKSKLRFFLPDGSSGWLRAGSRLTYTSGNNGFRNVNLEGEAYFQVYKNKSNPFIVSTQDFKVKVLGTSFTVGSYREASNSEVFLEEGKVEMLGINNKHQTFLKPGEQYSYNRDTENYSISKVAPSEKLSWTKGLLLLRNRKLCEVIQEMEHFYHVNIVLEDEDLKSIPVYAQIKSERLEEVMEYLTLILPIKYTIINPKRQDDGSFIKRKVVIKNIN